jgi:hypothetical protein
MYLAWSTADHIYEEFIEIFAAGYRELILSTDGSVYGSKMGKGKCGEDHSP